MQLDDALKLEGHGSTPGKRNHRTLKLLVIAQITIAMVIAVSSALMLRTLWNLHAVDPGFQTAGRLTFGISLTAEKYDEPKLRAAALDRTIEAVRTIPGGLSVAATYRLPMSMYVPYSVVPLETMTIVVHAATDGLSVAPVLLKVLNSVDSDLAIAALRPLNTVLEDSVGERSFAAILLGIFAGITVLLALFGIYAVLVYAVNERVGEIGLRMSLGANRADVIKHFLGDGLRLIAIGVALGSALALIATQLLSSLLFGVTPTDPVTFVVIAGLVTGAGVLACYVPAKRASLLNPRVAWRRG